MKLIKVQRSVHNLQRLVPTDTYVKHTFTWDVIWGKEVNILGKIEQKQF